MLFRKIINLMLHNKRNSAKMSISHGGIGEVVNTPDCGSGMRGFDPHISPHFKNNGTMYRFFVSKFAN